MPFLNKVNSISNKILTLLLGLILAGSLINSKLFIYPSLTAYFFFAVLISGLAIVSGVILLVRNKEQEFSLTFPVFIFLTLIAYSCLHGLFLHGYLNFRHNYFLFCGLLLLSAICVFRTQGFSYKSLFIIIGLLGVIESVWCLLQYISLIDSANTYFSVSGSWVNPNVTAMFLAMCLPVLLALWLIHTGIFRKVITISFIFILGALMLLSCRTAYIGAGTAIMLILNYRFGIIDWLKIKKNRPQSLFFIIFSLLILISVGIKLYESKKESADGRLLIWKISTDMLLQKPVTGYGYGMFEREYNLEQAKYISEGKVSYAELKNARHVNMAYNEFLQNAVEGGIVGIILFTALILSLLLLPVYKERYQLFLNLNKTKPEKQNLTEGQLYIVAAYANIVAFSIMSVMNFTIEAIPVMCLFIIFAAILSIQTFDINSTRQKNILSYLFRFVSIPSGIKSVTAILLIGSGLCIGYSQLNQAKAFLQNKAAADLIAKKQNIKALCLLLGVQKPLQYSESYWHTVGIVWFKLNDYPKAIKALEQAKEFTSNPEIYSETGKCYERTRQYNNAETNYRIAVDLEPSRFIPRYTLMQLCQNNGHLSEAQLMAKNILDKKTKIPSKEVQFCKLAAYKLLNTSTIRNKLSFDMRIANYKTSFSALKLTRTKYPQSRNKLLYYQK